MFASSANQLQLRKRFIFLPQAAYDQLNTNDVTQEAVRKCVTTFWDDYANCCIRRVVMETLQVVTHTEVA